MGALLMHPKPHLRQVNSRPPPLWSCGHYDGKGRYREFFARTPEEAYRRFAEWVEGLRHAGLLWEVFP